MLVIKRYANRKLYDIAASRYVTLKEIGEAIRQGDDVRVVDHTTGEDLTTLTLLQVLFEEEKDLGGFLPGRLLARIIRAGQSSLDGLREAANAFIDPDRYIEAAIHTRLETLQQNGQLSEEQSRELANLLLDPRFRRETAADHKPTDIQALLDELDHLSRELDSLIAGNDRSNGPKGPAPE